ncbi:M23 family metallopeptidase [Runella limosa]|uniref:M23 family metallopeptidase n=1 Tax=Runella limosa TaxID=370978 RepID=UPI000685643A|nr:M23 family metallopeptidase [Runella limosa]
MKVFVFFLVSLLDSTNTEVRSSLINQESFNFLIKNNRVEAARVPCIIPIKNFDGTRVSSIYGIRQHPVFKKMRQHHGFDIACGNQPIIAAGTGIVSKTGYSKGLGNFIKVIHGNGYETTYGHLSQVLVRKGDIVKLAQEIGIAGSTGLSTGTHLHYEVRFQGQLQDPIHYLLLLYRVMLKK